MLHPVLATMLLHLQRLCTLLELSWREDKEDNWEAQMNTLRTGQVEVRGSNESGQLESSGESSEGEETDDDYKSDAPDSEDDSNDVVLAFIASDEEYVDKRPATTRSGRAVTRRAEIDFSFF